jgi:hydroxysqualene dehydroxylase
MDVLIIGGGFAGLAAAVDLAAAGRRPCLLERRSFLGGRAYSFTDKVTGDVIDNGQHLMMGCYHAALGFLEKIGSTQKLKFQSDPQVDFLYEVEQEIHHTSFKCPPLPPPLHLVGGLARLGTIGWGDRAGALRVGLELKRLNGDRRRLANITVREWLTGLGQSERIQRKFWDIMALATLNDSSEVASADMFARVLDQAFLHTKRDSTMVISRVGLSDLYTHDARTFIESAGGEVRLNADVAEIVFDGDRARGVRMRAGELIEAETIISAVPYFSLRRMIEPEIIAASESFRLLDRFKSSPIISVNLWYEDQVVDFEFAGLLDSPIEWVFNKNAISGDIDRRRQHLALVISGAHEAARRNKEELIELAISTMNRFFPAACRSRPFHAFVVREYDATMSHTVGMSNLRPAQQTGHRNFFLAGDWTDTGLPATIESAVWSGRECARLALK